MSIPSSRPLVAGLCLALAGIAGAAFLDGAATDGAATDGAVTPPAATLAAVQPEESTGLGAPAARPTQAARAAGVAPPSPAAVAACRGTALDVTATRLLGQPENLCDRYAGRVVLVVNTASHCGFTPQYEGLEKLWRDYRGRGLVVLGFPSNQFAGQEFTDNKDIATFCRANFGVSFPMFSRGAVKGASPQPLYARLIREADETPGWNFGKYLLGRDGRVRDYYGPLTGPDSGVLRDAIEAALAEPPGAGGARPQG